LPQILTARDWSAIGLRAGGLWLLRLILVMLTIGSFFAIPSLTHCGGYLEGVITHRNLSAILQEWKSQCGGAINCSFDKSLAMQHMSRRLSPIADKADLSAKRRWQRDLEERPTWFFLPWFFATLFALTLGGNTRKYLLLLVGAIYGVMVAGCAGSTRLAAVRYPGTHAYLDDFVYLEPPFADFFDRHGEYVLVAHGSSPDHSKYRIVAMASGFVTGVSAQDLDHQLSCARPEPIPESPVNLPTDPQ